MIRLRGAPPNWVHGPFLDGIFAGPPSESLQRQAARHRFIGSPGPESPPDSGSLSGLACLGGYSQRWLTTGNPSLRLIDVYAMDNGYRLQRRP